MATPPPSFLCLLFRPSLLFSHPAHTLLWVDAYIHISSKYRQIPGTIAFDSIKVNTSIDKEGTPEDIVLPNGSSRNGETFRVDVRKRAMGLPHPCTPPEPLSGTHPRFRIPEQQLKNMFGGIEHSRASRTSHWQRPLPTVKPDRCKNLTQWCSMALGMGSWYLSGWVKKNKRQFQPHLLNF